MTKVQKHSKFQPVLKYQKSIKIPQYFNIEFWYKEFQV